MILAGVRRCSVYAGNYKISAGILKDSIERVEKGISIKGFDYKFDRVDR